MSRRLPVLLAALSLVLMLAGSFAVAPPTYAKSTSSVSSSIKNDAKEYCSSLVQTNSQVSNSDCVTSYEQGATAKNSAAVGQLEQSCKNHDSGAAQTTCLYGVEAGSARVTSTKQANAPGGGAGVSPQGCSSTGGGCIDANAVGIPQVPVSNVLKDVVTVLSFAAGVLSIVFLVIGGIRYSTSDGSAQNVSQAKQTITFAIIGLALSILAPLIVDFVIARGPQ